MTRVSGGSSTSPKYPMSPRVSEAHSKPVKVFTQCEPRSVVVEKYGTPHPPANRARISRATMTASTSVMQKRTMWTAFCSFP